MYSYINGKLTFKCPTYIVLEVGGIGYHVNISLHTYALIKEEEQCKIYTWLHVKEDSHTLYGFAEEGERRLFLHLISVSGIGPGSGRMMLSSANPEELQSAIVNGDVNLIKRIKGIGPKTAQRLILELQDKLKKEGLDTLVAIPNYNTAKDEAIAALVMLGFAKNIAEKSVDSVYKLHTSGGTLSVEFVIKTALKNL